MNPRRLGIGPKGQIPSIKPTMDKEARIIHLKEVIEYHEQIIRHTEQELAKLMKE